MCNSNVLGDEFHYIFECTYFKAERKKYVPDFYSRPNTLKLKNIIST